MWTKKNFFDEKIQITTKLMFYRSKNSNKSPLAIFLVEKTNLIKVFRSIFFAVLRLLSRNRNFGRR